MSQFMKTALALLSKGNLIHGIANKVSADYFSTSLSLGSVYLLRQFVSPPSVGSYRPCTTPISITLTPSVSFEDVTEDNTNFCRESFEIFQFENLKGHADLQQFLAGQSMVLQLNKNSYLRIQEICFLKSNCLETSPLSLTILKSWNKTLILLLLLLWEACPFHSFVVHLV